MRTIASGTSIGLLLIVIAAPFGNGQATSDAEFSDSLKYTDLNGQPTERQGKIIAYSGDGVQLKTSNGRELKVDRSRVLSFNTTWPDSYNEAEKLFQGQQFESALKKYQQAVRDEKRRWAKKLIFAKTIWCLRNMNRIADACDRFVAIVEDDPNTPHFATIPLAWTSAEPNEPIRQRCEKWIEHKTAAVRLIAASHLLPTKQRSDALTTLRQLAEDSPEPIQTLALAQIWRTRIVSVDASDLEKWQERIQTLPAELRPGPYYVLGKGWAANQQWDAAAISFLRCAIPNDQDQSLTIESIWQAAVSLEKQGNKDEAMRLFRELTVRFPTATLTAMARRRLQDIQSPAN